jgi:signal transduction histidine kinase
MQSRRLQLSPPAIFATVSLVLITATVVATSITQSSFFRQAIVDRMSVVLHDTVRASLLEQEDEGQLQWSDLDHYTEDTAQGHLAHSFRTMTNLSGVARIKVFNRDRTIVWSDEPRLIGTMLSANPEDLTRAIGGEIRAVFNAADRGLSPIEALPRQPLIEFYIPFSLGKADGKGDAVSGVLSIYRSPVELNETIQHGLFLLWLVSGGGGLVLFLAIRRLFSAVYFRQREVEDKFVKFSMEHQRIMQIEKLSAMGQMVSEIAHQLNSPLVGVINMAELAQREEDPQRVKELLADVRVAGEHCRGFVQRMLLINKVAHSEPKPTDMNRLVQDTIMFFQQSLGGRPAVTFEEPDPPITVEVDPVLVRHALFNLIHNAAQADPDGPVVVSLALESRDGTPGCRLAVADSGTGLSPAVQAKLFTPFFTTRPGGTGLGLSVAQHVAVLHGGSIHAENNPNGGARFSMWFPATKVS